MYVSLHENAMLVVVHKSIANVLTLYRGMSSPSLPHTAAASRIIGMGGVEPAQRRQWIFFERWPPERQEGIPHNCLLFLISLSHLALASQFS